MASIGLKFTMLYRHEFRVIEEVAAILHPIEISLETLRACDMKLYKCNAALNCILQ